MRCAVHPSRPATGTCPVCGRPRCSPDADRYGATGCEACQATPHGRVAPMVREIVVRAGLAGVVAAMFDGWVETQYVRVHLLSLLAPLVGGLAAAWACTAAAGKGGRQHKAAVLAISGAAAVLGAAPW